MMMQWYWCFTRCIRLCDEEKNLPSKVEGFIETEDMTLDVAWMQLLGLELESEEEIEEFHRNVAVWLDILASPFFFFYAIMPMPLLESQQRSKQRLTLRRRFQKRLML